MFDSSYLKNIKELYNIVSVYRYKKIVFPKRVAKIENVFFLQNLFKDFFTFFLFTLPII